MNYNMLWSMDEYKSILKYKWNTFKWINLFLSEDLTNREKHYKGHGKSIPRNSEEFIETLENVVNLYRAIKKNYILNGCKPLEKKLYRGTRNSSSHLTFASTTDDLSVALQFLDGIDTGKTESDTLLEIKSSSVPFIEIEKFISGSAGGDLNEHEVLFAPCYQKVENQIDFDDFKQSIDETKLSPTINLKLKRISNLDVKEVELVNPENYDVVSQINLSELVLKYNEYLEALSKISNFSKEDSEYQYIYNKIISFKKNVFSYLRAKFYQVDKEINELLTKENEPKIELSGDYAINQVKIGNTGKMYLLVDSDGQEYYFKPAINKKGEKKDYRAYIQEDAYIIQRIVNPENAVKCNVKVVNGQFGAIQEKVKIDALATKKFQHYFNNHIGELEPKIISQIMDEYLVDYCLCNYDANPNNFIIDENGNLRGIDKEQSFRYIEEDTENDMLFSHNFNEQYDERETIYTTIFKQILEGKISSQYLENFIYRAARIIQVPDEEYRSIFKNYAYSKMETRQEAELLLDKILERKKSIMLKVDLLIEQIKNAKYQNKKANLEMLRAELTSIQSSTLEEVGFQKK